MTTTTHTDCVPYSSLKAAHESPPLDALWNRAQRLLACIDTWRQRLHLLTKPVSELDEAEFGNSATVRLSHLIVEILIFRALHRRLFQAVPAGENPPEPIATIFESCYTSASAALGIVSRISAKHFASFWPACKSISGLLCYISAWLLRSKKYQILHV